MHYLEKVMHPRRSWGAQRLLTTCLLVLAISLMAGCGTSPVPGADNPSLSGTGQDSGQVQSVQDQIADGTQQSNVFADVQPAALPAGAEIVIEGTIDSREDVDVFALGPTVAGDLIVVDVAGRDGLNTVAALFDGNGDLIDANDDRSYYAGALDPYLARVIRRDTATVYLGIAVSSSTHFASDSGRYDSGSYTVRLRREADSEVPAARNQLVYLSFEGGARVQIGLEPIEVMRPLSAESISGRLAGQTDYIISLLTEHMRRDLAAYDVTLLSSKNHQIPAEEHSALYFGNFNANYLGLADNVDTGNTYLQQEAIIYAEDLSMFEGLLPSAEETALALANIASHELGHLLGLEHSAEAGDLMATAATARQILEVDAAFARTTLLNGVFPVGWQNGPALLLQNVGANPSGASNARLRIEDLLPREPPAFRDLLQDIPILQCGRCAP